MKHYIRKKTSRSRRTRRTQSTGWSRKSTQYKDFEVGELVMLKEYCASSNRPAIIVDLPDTMYTGYNACKIQYVDEAGLREGPVSALLSNLMKINSYYETKDG